MRWLVRALAAALLVCVSPLSHAQFGPPAPPLEPGDVQGLYQSAGLSILDENAFGDSIDLDTGALSFTQIDVSIPGNSEIPVVFGRRLTRSPISADDDAGFGNWDPLIPYMRQNYLIANGPQTNRCSGPLGGPWTTNLSYSTPGGGVVLDTIYRHQFFNGIELYTETGSAQTLLEYDGSAEFSAKSPRLVSKGNWIIECITAPSGGEGFLATAPNGLKYRFDVITNYATRSDSNYPTRSEVIYASRIEDRHGNWVNYSYSGNKLSQITSSDGRTISVTWTGNKITSVTSNGRTWTYQYTANTLTRVNRPDGTYWTFTATDALNDRLTTNMCPGDPYSNIVVKHPDGTTATYAFRVIINGRYELPPATTDEYRGILDVPCPVGAPGHPAGFFAVAVDTKTISFPSGPTNQWSYFYSEDGGSYAGDPAPPSAQFPKATTPTKYRIVTHPDGTKTKTIINRQYGASEGNIERVERLSSTNAVLEYTEFTYVVGHQIGKRLFADARKQSLAASNAVYTTETVLVRGADEYETVSTFQTNPAASDYAYGAPATVTYSSNVTIATRSEATTYTHKTTPWVLALPTVYTQNGKEIGRIIYNGLGQPTGYRKFGNTSNDFSYTYHSSGDQKGRLASVTDALSRTTSFANYKRGAPQTFTRADSSTVTQVIDNNGWTTSVTDARGITVSLGYDSVGRVTSVNRPSPWSDTTVGYSGLGTGSMTQTVTTGDLRTTTTFDGFIRPVLVKTEALDTGATIYSRKTYDSMGRTSFVSFPSASSSAPDGSTTSYDALGRVTGTVENVAPYVSTSTAYLSGNCVQVTDPESEITTTCSAGFGSPDDGYPVSIDQPEGIDTDMSYDAWGNLTSVTQGGGTTGPFTQVWKYDDRLRVCLFYTPETGSTFYDYDAGDQLTEYLEGQSGLSCPSSIGAGKTVLEYDDLGRLENTLFPAGTPSIYRTYDASGNVLTVNRGGVNWTYVYHASANLLTSETLTIDSETYATSYSYDANQSLDQMTYPGGRTVAFAPDGMGRPTQAYMNGATFLASAASYHPNGALAAYSLGNGLAFSQTLTQRQQPLRRIVGGGGLTALDLEYTYNARSQITSITDRADTGNNRTYAYDGVGRLETASGPWGTGNYEYDAVGNLLEKELGARTVALEYSPSTNRLTRVSDSAASGGAWRDYAYDARGNVLDDELRVFTYDAANQPDTLSYTAAAVEAVLEDGPDPYTGTIAGAPTSGAPPVYYTFSNGVATVTDLATARYDYLMTREVIAAEPGVTYRIRAEVRTTGSVSISSGGHAVSLYFRKLDAGYSYITIGGYVSLSFPLDGSWNTVETTYTAVSGDVYLRPGMLRRIELTGSGDLEVRNLTIERLAGGPANATYTYDGNLKRVKQDVNGEVTYSVYSASGQLIQRDNDSTGDVTDFVSFGGGTLARIEGGVITYTYADHLGTPVRTSTVLGGLTAFERYSPYGENLTPPSANADLQGFTGHIEDGATGLTYMQARYYDPVIGRFLSKDPVTFTDGGPGYFNRYWYTMGDPVNATDPTGMFSSKAAEEAIERAVQRITTAAIASQVDSPAPGPGDIAAAGIAAVTTAALIYDLGKAVFTKPDEPARADLDDLRSWVSDKAEGKDPSTSTASPKSGETGGPGAGKDFSRSVQEAARRESPNCVFCTKRTIRSSKPHPNRSNIDHAWPKSRGGNNSINNAQNTCQACNLKKRARTTEEYLNNKK